MLFRRGAFAAESAIQPVYLQYYSPYCTPSFDVIPTMLHFFFISCQPYTTITVSRLPVVYPTPYMYNKYKDWGTSNGDIYAAVVRDIYSRTFNLPKSPWGLKDKDNFYHYLYDPTKTKFE